jgi:hypothetical protein
MKEAVLKAKGSLVDDVKRRLENRLWSYEQSLDEREEYLEAARADGGAERLLDIFSSTAASLMLIGEGRFRLDGDVDGARDAFRKLEIWIPFYTEGVEIAARADTTIDPVNLLAPVVCFALAGLDDSMFRIAMGAENAVFALPRRAPKNMLLASRFSLDFASCVRPAKTKQTAYKANPPIPAGHSFHGYDRLLQPLADGDSKEFNAACAPLEQAFLARAKERDDSLNWYGYGKLAQAACFDALGTAMMRIAHLRGLKVAGDSPVHPRAFIS